MYGHRYRRTDFCAISVRALQLGVIVDSCRHAPGLLREELCVCSNKLRWRCNQDIRSIAAETWKISSNLVGTSMVGMQHDAVPDYVLEHRSEI